MLAGALRRRRSEALARRAPDARAALQARDAYYACVDSGSAFPCWRSRRAFTAACPAAWVKHFDNKREERERVAKTLQLITQPRFSKPQQAEQPAGSPP